MRNETIVGIDIGGTKIRAGRVSAAGKIMDGLRIPTEAKKGSVRVLRNIIDATARVWSPGVGAIGVGMAGIVDHHRGVFVGGPNLPKDLRNTPLAALLRRRFRVPVAIDNDAHCFTLAEAKIGAAKRFSHVVGLTFGTGIGGGIVTDGRLYRGRNNAAGEFGHTIVNLDGKERCGCGRTGHFEAYASGTSMSNLYFGLTGKRLDPVGVENAAAAGDKKAKEVFAAMADALAAGLASIILSLNPDIIVVGGGLSMVKTLWRPVIGHLRKAVIFPGLKDTPVVRSALGADANIIGAALLAGTRPGASNDKR